MDENVILFEGVVNKLQGVINEKESSDPTSDRQRPLNRRSSDESAARNPSYPSTCSNSSPETPPDPPTARTLNDPCNNWSDMRNSLENLPSADSSKHTRKKIFKKRVKSKRVNDSSYSTPVSETSESKSSSEEAKMPLLKLHGNVIDPKDHKAPTQKPKLKRRRSQEENIPLRKSRRCNSLDESLAISKRSSNDDRHQVKKRNSSFEYNQKKKSLKRRNSSSENLQPRKKI